MSRPRWIVLSALLLCVLSVNGAEQAPAPKAVQPSNLTVWKRAPGIPVGTHPVEIGPAPRPAEVIYRLHPIHSCPTRVTSQPLEEDVTDWGHNLIGVPDAWKTATGKGVVVAVLDTGGDHDHRDLKGRIVASKDFTGSRSGASDVHGHGTHCAGIVLAEKNAVGMVGVAPDAKLLIGKVLGDSGSGSNRGIAAGIDWAVEQGADVISMSLGGPSPDSLTHEAIKRAVAKGVIVICAAGNEGPRDDTVGYPGGYPESIAVAAVDVNGNVANFSSRGAEVFVGAPGVAVRSCYPGDRFATMSGTSMACPYVAGCAALYVEWAKANNVTPDYKDFKARVEKSAKDIGPPGRDRSSGFGIVKPAGLFDGGKEPPDPKDPPVPPIDTIEIVAPGIVWNGRPVKRIVIELEPIKKEGARP